VQAIAVAPSGRWVFTGSDDGTLKVWSFKRYKVRAVLSDATDSSSVHAVAVSPSESHVTAGTENADFRGGVTFGGV
jgi:WD40 repeat protein